MLATQVLDELLHAEDGYRLSLAKLLGTCSPLRPSTPATATPQLTHAVRRLVAHHQSLHQLLMVEDEGSVAFVTWFDRCYGVYGHYISHYYADADTLPLEGQLRKVPLQRLTQLCKTAQKLEYIPEHVILQLEKLVERARDVVEQQNLKIDLNTIHFDQVKALDDEMSSTVAYFRVSDIVERDYFEFELTHPQEEKPEEKLVEVFRLKNDTLAICLVQSVGRSLMFPPFKVSDYTLEENSLDWIHMTRDSVELKLRCPDQRQMNHWNSTVAELAIVKDDKFFESHFKLSPLKKGRVGLGLHAHNQTMGVDDSPPLSLRKSNTMIAKHNSLNRQGSQMSQKLSNVDHYFNATNTDLQKIDSYTSLPSHPELSQECTPEIQQRESPHLEKSDEEDFANYVSAIQATFSPDSLELSPVQPLNIKKQLNNDSVVSLPNVKHSEASIELNKKFAQSTTDVSQKKTPPQKTKKEKMKRRKSIFNLFKKKETTEEDDNEFEIVAKSKLNSAPEDGEGAEKPQPASMASLYRNVHQLSISTTSLPQSKPSVVTPVKQLSPTEKHFIQQATTSQTITNSCIVSRWSQNKWQHIGKPYRNEIRVLHTTATTAFALYTDLVSETPELLIPLNHPRTTVTKSSALDLQIRCPQSVDSTLIHILTIRCCDSKTVSTLMKEFHRSQEEDEKSMSSSSTLLFDKPSNSTSMSSINNMSSSSSINLSAPPMIAPPKIYGMPTHSNSTLSVGSRETTQPSSASSGAMMGELLLKNNIKIRLHKQDDDGDWIPVSLGKFSLSSSVTNPEYSRFLIKCVTGDDVEALVKNSLCTRLGKAGLRFSSIDDYGDELCYLVEFKNQKACEEVYEILV